MERLDEHFGISSSRGALSAQGAYARVVQVKKINFCLEKINYWINIYDRGEKIMDISKAYCVNCARPMVVTEMSCVRCDLHLTGRVDVPPLAQLDEAEQAFVIAFVRQHGSIKKMEELFGISYPTVKNRLNAISAKLHADFELPPSHNHNVLERLARGDISVEEALEALG